MHNLYSIWILDFGIVYVIKFDKLHDIMLYISILYSPESVRFFVFLSGFLLFIMLDPYINLSINVCVIFFFKIRFHYQVIIRTFIAKWNGVVATQSKFFEPLLQLIYVVWTKRKLPIFVFFPILSFICFYRLTFHIFFFFLFIDAVGHLIMDWETSVVSFTSICGAKTPRV